VLFLSLDLFQSLKSLRSIHFLIMSDIDQLKKIIDDMFVSMNRQFREQAEQMKQMNQKQEQLSQKQEQLSQKQEQLSQTQEQLSQKQEQLSKRQEEANAVWAAAIEKIRERDAVLVKRREMDTALIRLEAENIGTRSVVSGLAWVLAGGGLRLPPRYASDRPPSF
jgi:chromosome segregation ATPase